MTENIRVFSHNNESKQIISEDRINYNDIIEPFFSFDKMLELYYANTYHKLCIDIKIRVLSLVDNAKELAPLICNKSPGRFMIAFTRELEIYGNAFVEIAGNNKYKALYLLPAREARIDKEHNVYQTAGLQRQWLNAAHIAYDSPSSRFYGEPDYLAAIGPILVNKNIDLYNEMFFQNGAVPRLAIMFENSEPSDEQLEAFKKFFSSGFKGIKNAHKSLILTAPPNPDGTSAKINIQELGETKDLSYEKLKSIGRDEIIAAHCVPPRLAGVVNSGGWGGSGEFLAQMHSFNEMVIKPKQEIIEEFFANLGIKIRLKPLDITSFKDDSELVRGLVEAGIISIPEARNIIGWQKNIASV
jgi:PBSX family phage portal protein